MSPPADVLAFEAFYVASRDRLLLQTLAWTEDRAAAQRAVREAMTSAGHHWRRVGRMSDPQAWVRSVAWDRSQRRSGHRAPAPDSSLGTESQAVLAALGRLSPIQRRLLVLHLTCSDAGPGSDLAREVGLTPQRAEAELLAALAGYTAARGLPPAADGLVGPVDGLLDPVAADLAGVRWPRPTLLTRAASRRRRGHTLTGVVAASAALVLSGIVVTAGDGHRTAAGLAGLVHRDRDTGPDRTSGPPPDPVTAADLVGPDAVDVALPGRWQAAASPQDVPCRPTTYADTRHTSGAVQAFAPATSGTTGSGAGAGAAGGQRVTQTAEVSRTARAAAAAYARTVGWYAACTDGRVQLMATWRVSGAGDAATLLELHDWRTAQTLVVGVARTGTVTTSTTSTTGTRASDVSAGVAGATVLLGDAVQGVCGLSAAGGCGSTQGRTPTRTPVDPPAFAHDPALVGVVDLPPVTHVTGPWVGTRTAPATVNLAATRCDQTSFAGNGVTRARTRSFVIPTAARLPPEFGLSESVGHVSGGKAAGAFVDAVRAKLASCSKRDLGTSVVRVSTRATGSTDLTVWHVRVKISATSTVRYLMAVLRSRSAVAQLGFVPSGTVDMTGGAFLDLAQRALQRLPELDESAAGSS